MSTRALVAVPYGDSWRGRHTHSDGYPTGRGKDLWALVDRDGLETVRRVITEEHYGWSSINPDQPDLKGVKIPKSYEEAGQYGTPGWYAFHLKAKGKGAYADGRFVNVPHYGVAYTTEQGQTSEDGEKDWADPTDTWDSEWAYVLADDALWILECHCDNPPTLVGTYRWGRAEPDWEAIEKKAGRRLRSGMY